MKQCTLVQIVGWSCRSLLPALLLKQNSTKGSVSLVWLEIFVANEHRITSPRNLREGSGYEIFPLGKAHIAMGSVPGLTRLLIPRVVFLYKYSLILFS